MASTTISSFDPALKQLYRKENVEKLTFKRRPLFGLLPKFEGFGGRNMPIVQVYGNPQGRSAVFSTAQSNATAISVGAFLLTRVNNYSVATIDGDAIEATAGDNMAFLQALKLKIDTAMAALADDIETSLFRKNYGWISTIGAVSTANPMVITLAQIEEITGFEVGMTLIADDTEDGSSPRATPASIVIAGINRSTGTITTGYDNSGSATNWAASDYLYVSGDQSRKISGLMDWFPASVSATTFFGVNRTLDTRLAGVYHDGSASTVEEAIIDIQSKVSREGGAPDVFLLPHVQNRRLMKELGAKKTYSSMTAEGAKGQQANVSYTGVIVDGDHGPLTVIAANKCPAVRGFALTKETLTFNTLGSAVKLLQEDGNKILRQATSDGYEVRIGFRGNLGCNAPIWNGHVLLPNP